MCLPGLSSWAVRLVVSALYERRLEVCADSLEPLLRAASFLGAAAVLEACAAVGSRCGRGRAGLSGA